MSSYISDVTVNISVEDVVNPAAFGGICLYAPYADDSEAEAVYAEAYSYDEAVAVIEENGLTDVLGAMAQIAFSQEDVPEKISILGCKVDDIQYYLNYDWRYLIISTTDISVVLSAAAYIESCDGYKVLAVDLSTTSGGFATPYDDYVTNYETLKSYERTVACVGVTVTDDDGNAVCNSICTALFAETASKDVGSFTYKNQALKSVYADESAAKAQVTEYHSYGVNAYLAKAGYDVTSEGICVNGDYIDILDAKDWLVTQIKYQLQQTLIINDKVPYTNSGISLLESVVVNILQSAYNSGMIAEDDNGEADYTVTFKKRSETEASDRELRKYVEGYFTFALAGAIHTVTVNGTITI